MRGLNNGMALAMSHAGRGTFSVGVRGTSTAGACGRPCGLPGLGTSTDGAGVHYFLMPRNSCVGFLRSGVIPVNNLASTRSGGPLSVMLRGMPSRIGTNASLRRTITKVATVIDFRRKIAGAMATRRLRFATVPGVGRLNAGALMIVCGGAFGNRGYGRPIITGTAFRMIRGVMSVRIATRPTRARCCCCASTTARAVASHALTFLPRKLRMATACTSKDAEMMSGTGLRFSTVPTGTNARAMAVATRRIATAMRIGITRSIITTIDGSTNVVKTRSGSAN